MNPETYITTFDVHLLTTKNQPARFVETIELEVFRSFDEEILTPESSEKIEHVKALHLGLMTGADIKAMRERLKLPQKQLPPCSSAVRKPSPTGKTATAIRPDSPTPSCACSMRD